MIKAVLWDLDGVLLDSASLHFISWQRLFNNLGRGFSYGDFTTTFGLCNDAILRQNLGPLPREEIERLGFEKEELFRAKLRRKVVSLPGAVRLVKAVHARGRGQAVVSSAPRRNIDLALEGLGVAELFHAVVSDEDVEQGKPDPQGYLLAAEHLDVEPGECVVVEDAPGGVAAGRAGGMKVIGLASSHSTEDLDEADLVVTSLEDERVWSCLLKWFPDNLTPPEAQSATDCRW